MYKQKAKLSDFINLGTTALVIASVYFANKGNTHWAWIFLGVLIFFELLSFIILLLIGFGTKMIINDASKLLIKANEIHKRIDEYKKWKNHKKIDEEIEEDEAGYY